MHLTHQNLSARALFCLNSLAKVNTQLLIYNHELYMKQTLSYSYNQCTMHAQHSVTIPFCMNQTCNRRCTHAFTSLLVEKMGECLGKQISSVIEIPSFFIENP